MVFVCMYVCVCRVCECRVCVCRVCECRVWVCRVCRVWVGPDNREVVTGLFYTTLCDLGLSPGCRLPIGWEGY